MIKTENWMSFIAFPYSKYAVGYLLQKRKKYRHLNIIYCIKVNRLFRNTKGHYNKTKLENSKGSKDSWEYINELLNRKQNTSAISQLKIDGQIVTGPENIANEFNKYFCEIGPKFKELIHI